MALLWTLMWGAWALEYAMTSASQSSQRCMRSGVLSWSCIQVAHSGKLLINFGIAAAVVLGSNARACFAGAFNMTTGPAHWELLQRARAVDNQVFVATCSPARDANASYQAWGHSTVVGPFAEVVATTDEKPGIVYAQLDYAQLQERRTNMPVMSQKRLDLYALVDKKQR